jgi:signal transduction histidine kinase
VSLVRPVACIVAVLAVAGAVAASVATAFAPDLDAGAPSLAIAPFLLLAVAAPAAVGAFVALRRPGNRVAWILLAGAWSVGWVMAASTLAPVALDAGRPGLAAWCALVAQEWPVLFAWPLALAFAFPTGRLPSRRWRAPAALAALSCGGLLVVLLLTPDLAVEGGGELANPLPLTVSDSGVGEATVVVWVLWVAMLVSLFAGAAAVAARYRAGDAVERRQVLWLAYGALLVPLWLGGSQLASIVLGVSGDGFALLLLLHAWLALAVAVAVTRHGLYGIDRLLNRTLVYGALTAALAAVYAAAALLAGLVAGRGSALAASLATLAAAAAFRPLRSATQELVDRRFARARHTGVRIVGAFLDDVRDGRAEPEDVGDALVAALRDPSAEVVLRLPESGELVDRHGRVLDGLPDDGRARTVIGRDDRELGVLLHDPQPAAGDGLVAAVLHAAAVPVELARLRVELQRRLAEVRFSRARILEAGYEERRRLERDLHDGAQQRLVSLGIHLRRLQRSLPPQAGMLSPALDAAVGEVADAIADLRTIAAGVRPPRLDEGLAAALADLARTAPVEVDLRATPTRAPPEIEAAAYFVACEALTNAVKHGAPSRISVETTRDAATLRLVVCDDGAGGAVAGDGSGLTGLEDRVRAHGGTLAIESPQGAGTRIALELPCAS